MGSMRRWMCDRRYPSCERAGSRRVGWVLEDWVRAGNGVERQPAEQSVWERKRPRNTGLKPGPHPASLPARCGRVWHCLSIEAHKSSMSYPHQYTQYTRTQNTVRASAHTHLVQEGLEHVARLGHGDDAGSARVVDAIVQVINTAGVDDLLA